MNYSSPGASVPPKARVGQHPRAGYGRKAVGFGECSEQGLALRLSLPQALQGAVGAGFRPKKGLCSSVTAENAVTLVFPGCGDKAECLDRTAFSGFWREGVCRARPRPPPLEAGPSPVSSSLWWLSAVLGLQMCHFCLHVAFFPPCMFLCLLVRTLVTLDSGPSGIKYNLILTNCPLETPFP